jgi:hypothetical protein
MPDDDETDYDQPTYTPAFLSSESRRSKLKENDQLALLFVLQVLAL